MEGSRDQGMKGSREQGSRVRRADHDAGRRAGARTCQDPSPRSGASEIPNRKSSALSDAPGSSTKLQHQRLVMAGRDRGLDLNEIRSMCGGSLRALSARAASDWITRFTGRDLPNPPGQAPRAYRHPAPGTTRMIAEKHIGQILLLLCKVFPTLDAGLYWLAGNFKIPVVNLKSTGRTLHSVTVASPTETIRQLGTARRAGEVIRVLKAMRGRAGGEPRASARADSPPSTPQSRVPFNGDP